MRKLFLALALILILTFITIANIYAEPAATDIAIKCTGVKHSFAWIEPTQNAAGAPITNLSYSNVYYQINNEAIKVKKYKARAATGGTKRSGTIITSLDCKIPNSIKIWIEHVDAIGGKSLPSPIKELKTIWEDGANSRQRL